MIFALKSLGEKPLSSGHVKRRYRNSLIYCKIKKIVSIKKLNFFFIIKVLFRRRVFKVIEIFDYYLLFKYLQVSKYLLFVTIKK